MSETETFLILKYGSISDAFSAWLNLSSDEQMAIPHEQYCVLMEYEYNMQINGPGPFEPR